MATSADVIRSVNAILQSGERREQTRLQTSLAMMEFAQRKKVSDISLASQKLQIASAANTQLQTTIASDFMSATGLGIFYEDAEEGKKKSAMESAAESLSNDYGFAQEVANSTVSALWSYYEAKDPRAVVKIASNLGTSIEEVASAHASGKPLGGESAESRLVQSFANLSDEAKGIGDLQAISKQAMKNLSNEFLITKESMEFAQGDYDISSDIGIYEDIQEPTKEYLEGGDFLSTEQGMNVLNKVIEAAKKDEPWDPGLGTSLAIVGGAYGAQYIDPAIKSEVAKYSSGYDDYMKQLADDLKRQNRKYPDRGGLSSSQFKAKYGHIKGNVIDKQKEALKAVDKFARKAGWRNTTSVGGALDALKKVQQGKYLSKAGEALGKGAIPYFAPTVGRIAGEAIGDELGGAVGQTAGTGLLVNKVAPVAGKAKASFITFLGRKFPSIVGKGAALAMADSPVLPFGDIAGLGLAGYEIYNTYKAWQAYVES